LLFIVIFISTLLEKNVQMAARYTLLNSVFLLVQLAIVFIYFWIKRGKISGITHKLIGWGDILFLFVVTPGFSLPLYVLYMTTGMLLTLLVYLLVHLFYPINLRSYPIPLAGIMAAYVIILKMAQWFFPQMAENINSIWVSGL
jgi:hypothetical protein